MSDARSAFYSTMPKDYIAEIALLLFRKAFWVPLFFITATYVVTTLIELISNAYKSGYSI